MTVAIAGATGLIGSELVKILNEAGVKGHALTRSSGRTGGGSIAELVVDYENLTARYGVDTAVCCLGTTMRVAGSREAFRKVDEQYVLNFAEWARENGAKHFILVSSIGADAKGLSFYLRVKGQVEAQLQTMDWQRLSILRPSMLLGDRKDTRLGEEIGGVIMRATSFLMQGPLKNYRAIKGSTVAEAIHKIIKDGPAGIKIYESADIETLGKRS